MKFSPKDLLAMLLLAFLGSCDGADLPPGPPEPMGLGLLAVVLDTPNSNDGAFLVTLTGGPVDSLRRGQLRVISSDAGPSQRRVIVSGLVRASNSARMAVIGSTRVARRAGRYEAINATPVNRMATIA